MPTLRDYEDVLYYCMRCGFCRAGCPTLSQRDMEETFSPRGRMLLIHGLARGELNPSMRITDKVYLCTTCRNCYVKCPSGLEIDKIIEAARHELVRAGVAPPKPHKGIALNIKRTDNPFGELRMNRIKWLEGSKISFPEKAGVLYWVGCMASYRVQNIARATVQILRHAGVNFTILGEEEGCCGSVLLRTGQREPVEKEYAQANVEKIRSKGVETLITACAGCYRTFRKDYVDILGGLPFEVLHVSEYLERLMKEGSIQFERELSMKVTYHDPCHLGRHMGVYAPPRNVIRAIPGLTLVEMERTREEAYCCGAGGGLRSAYRELSLRIAADRLRMDVLPTGADILVTPCPFCVLNFRNAASDYGVEVKVLDLVELVFDALGLAGPSQSEQTRR